MWHPNTQLASEKQNPVQIFEHFFYTGSSEGHPIQLKPILWWIGFFFHLVWSGHKIVCIRIHRIWGLKDYEMLVRRRSPDLCRSVTILARAQVLFHARTKWKMIPAECWIVNEGLDFSGGSALRRPAVIGDAEFVRIRIRRIWGLKDFVPADKSG